MKKDKKQARLCLEIMDRSRDFLLSRREGNRRAKASGEEKDGSRRFCSLLEVR
jgi:hypothetical protein